MIMSILQPSIIMTQFAVDGVSPRDPAFAKARLSACANVVVMSNYEVNTMHDDDDDVDGAREKNLAVGRRCRGRRRSLSHFGKKNREIGRRIRQII
jgi:hypothetical protein